MMKPKDLKDGDIIEHGFLGQLWLVIKKKGQKPYARIISLDSGLGHEEELTVMGLFLEDNYTQLIGNIHGKRKIKEEFLTAPAVTISERINYDHWKRSILCPECKQRVMLAKCEPAFYKGDLNYVCHHCKRVLPSSLFQKKKAKIRENNLNI